jgi:anhydro-N-acetylmuramic acid kinase
MHRHFIGLSSGSSFHGVDAALVRVDGAGSGMALRLEHFASLEYPRELRQLLHKADSAAGLPLRQTALLHRLLGEAYAAAVRKLTEAARVNLTAVFALGCSGQTLGHDPDGRYPTTLTLGMSSVLAERTGLTTISDWRSRDVVVGGQGAPLTPLVDHLLFHDPGETRVLVHLGGVATVLALPADDSALHPLGRVMGEGQAPGGPKNLAAFHAAPCCLLLDGFMQQLTSGREPYDAGGKHAVQGRCIDAILERWLAHPVLLRRPPKTVSRVDFGTEFIEQAIASARQMGRSLHDLLCTATHFVARATVEAIRRFVLQTPTRILISGGGTRNGFLWRLLEEQLTPVPMERTDRCGISAEARKAVAFAALAALTLDGVPANLPSVTGASGPRLLGTLTPGASANWARCVAWMAQQAAAPQLPRAA